MIKNAIQKLVNGESLSNEEIMGAMNCIMNGEATQAQIGSFMTALRIKGETIEEITGCARVMRDKAEKITLDLDYYIDTCGTGGDGAKTFNVSTASAFVAAAGAVNVAKHGNRSVSSKSGSADVLEALGAKIDLSPYQVKKCIEDVGIGFLFAPSFHKSMKHAAGPRRELGIRTIFNILGPLTNPAGAAGQVLGVYDSKLTEPVANVLLNLGIERALVFNGNDGVDEITTTTSTRVSELKDGWVNNYEFNPEQYGIKKACLDDIKGGDAAVNAEIIRNIFKGAQGPERDIVVVNSAAALYVGKKVDSLEEGIEKAQQIIDSGLVLNKLQEFIEYTNALVSDAKAQ